MPTEEKKKNRKFCNEAGLFILPLRYAAFAGGGLKDVNDKVISELPGTGLPFVALLEEHFPSLRLQKQLLKMHPMNDRFTPKKNLNWTN